VRLISATVPADAVFGDRTDAHFCGWFSSGFEDSSRNRSHGRRRGALQEQDRQKRQVFDHDGGMLAQLASFGEIRGQTPINFADEYFGIRNTPAKSIGVCPRISPDEN
jgi:hypothetical protein